MYILVFHSFSLVYPWKFFAISVAVRLTVRSIEMDIKPVLIFGLA